MPLSEAQKRAQLKYRSRVGQKPITTMTSKKNKNNTEKNARNATKKPIV